MNTKDQQKSDFDFEAHRLLAISRYQKVRPLYEEFAEAVKGVINEALRASGIRVHSIEARAKSIDSFGKKASSASDSDPARPEYSDPITEITDLAGVRIITFLVETLRAVDEAVNREFDVIEQADKADILLKQEKFGYHSIHYLARFRPNRTALPEYKRFQDLMAEIQLRTILQHAWAEIQHDIQYKSVETIPSSIGRRFMSLAGMLEIADREFQAIQNEDERLRSEARKSVRAGHLEKVEITPDALKAYLDKKLGSDGRMTKFSYEFTARQLRRLGFSNFQQIDECIRGYDANVLSNILWGTRQGQISRFEYQLLAGMGQDYIRLHPWNSSQWFVNSCQAHLEELRDAGVKIGNYRPPSSDTNRTA